MSFTLVNGSGVALGNGGATFARVSAPSANVLQLAGTTGNVCRLTNLADPQGDTDAANRLYVQSYVTSQIHGLQLQKISAAMLYCARLLSPSS